MDKNHCFLLFSLIIQTKAKYRDGGVKMLSGVSLRRSYWTRTLNGGGVWPFKVEGTARERAPKQVSEGQVDFSTL